MNPNVIQFACGHCQSWLTVPAQMAGVAGPCPKCGHHIVSPAAPAPPAYEPAPIAQAPAGNWTPAIPQPPAPAQAPQWPGAGLLPPQESFLPPMQGVPQAPMGRPLPAAQDLYPPAPAAAPLIPPPTAPPSWGQLPGNGSAMPDSGLPGGYPLHAQGLRPNAGMPLPAVRAPVSPPPAGPGNPAGMFGQQPGGLGFEASAQTGGLTRPASVGGSRLSLLARQLTTPAEGAPGLPVAPAPLSTSELPGQAPMAHAAPGGSKNEQAADLMLQQSMRRGLSVSHSPSRGRVKFALAALVIVGLLGGLVWGYRAPLRDIVAQVFPPQPALPETASPPASGPVPGVDRAVAPSSAETAAPSSQQETTIARAVPMAASQDAEEVKAVPLLPPDARAGNTKPAASQTSKEGLALIATMNAPRAIAVDGAETPVQIKAPAAPEGGASTDNPLVNGQQRLVEVGRTSTDPKMAQSSTPAPTPGLVTGQPTIKNVPPACKPALDGLLSFLNARSWRDRLKFIQLPEQMEPKLKLYYASNPDGPVDVDEIQYLRHDESPQVGKGLHAVFVLFSRNWEYGFPVMVEVTPEGARVDWLTFIEFKDDMLNKFMSNYMEERVQFHVGIHRTHYFDDNIPGLDQKEQFSVTSPMENVRGFVFVTKGTHFASSLASTLSWDKDASWVVVELQWRKEGSSKWVEMTALPQLNWYSAGTPQGSGSH